MPFKGIRFARSLSDKGFPVDICCDARVAGAIAHPADHSIRIDRDRIVGLYIAECDRVSVSDDRHISFASSSGKCGGSKTFLGQNADTDEADAVFAVLCKCKQVFGFDRDRFARFQFIDQNMLCAFCVIGFGWTVHGDFGKRNVFTVKSAYYEGYINVRPLEKKDAYYGTCFEIFIPEKKKLSHELYPLTWDGKDYFDEDYDILRPIRHSVELMAQMAMYLDSQIGQQLFPVELKIIQNVLVEVPINTTEKNRMHDMHGNPPIGKYLLKMGEFPDYRKVISFSQKELLEKLLTGK